MEIAGTVRLAFRLLAMLALLLICVPLHYIWRLFAYGSPVPKYFLKLVGRIAGAKVVRVGTPLKRDVFYISNHVSWLDIMALAGASGTAFVAKAELADTPLVGWLCRLNRTVFIRRENKLGVAEQINALREALSDNWAVTVFPEGTTGDGHTLLPFKSSMLQVLDPPPAGVLVQPVLIDYGEMSDFIAWVGEESGVTNFKKVLARKESFPVAIHYLEPFSPQDVRGRKAIAAEAHKRIKAALAIARGDEGQENLPSVRYNRPVGEKPERLDRS